MVEVEGSKTHDCFDSLNGLETIYTLGDSVMEVDNSRTHYGFDRLNRLVKSYALGDSGMVVAGSTTPDSFDRLNRLKRLETLEALGDRSHKVTIVEDSNRLLRLGLV